MSSPTDALHPPLLPEQRLSDADIQAMLARATRLFAERFAERQEMDRGPLAAFPPGAEIAATDAVVAVTAMLKAVNVQLFELGMWQAWAR